MSEEAWKLLDPYSRGSVGLDTVLRMLTTIDGCEKVGAWAGAWARDKHVKWACWLG